MLDWDKVWRRVSKLREFANRKQENYRYIGIGKQFSLTSTQVSATTAVDFPAGSIILGINAGLHFAGAASAVIRGLTGIRVSIDYPSSDGAVITGGRMNGAALWGGDQFQPQQFPAKELIIPDNGTLNVVVENLTTSTIAVDVVFHSMIYRASAR